MVFTLVLNLVQNLVAYVWPAYLTYKALEAADEKEKDKWTIYWCVIGCFTTVEFFLDILFFWIPFYQLSKVAFVIYLWHPKTKGAQMLYSEFIAPYLSANKNKIDEAAAKGNAWICAKYTEAKEKALVLLGRSAVVVLEKAQEISTPKKDSPRYQFFADNVLTTNNSLNNKQD